MMDVGVNLTSARFSTDLAAVLQRASAAGVAQLVTIGIDLETSVKGGMLARSHPGVVYTTAGVHPHRASAFRMAELPLFEEIWADSAVVAIGETGLDYYRMLSPAATQRAVFEIHLEAALSSSKPVFLHCRGAHPEFLQSVKVFCNLGGRGIVHCFTGGRAELEDYLALGLEIGISGWVCDHARSKSLRDAIALIPAEKLHLETDAPFLPPVGYSGLERQSRNEPGYLVHIAHEVASLRQECPHMLAQQCAANSRRFFDIPEPVLISNETPKEPS